MKRIGMVGINWKYGGAEALAQFTIPVDERAERLPELARLTGATELVYLATCNRVELIFVTDADSTVDLYRARFFEAITGRAPNPGEAERTFKAWTGEGAVEHLFLVTSGLDSAKVGETDIAGQVRQAYELARQVKVVGPSLSKTFDEALRVASKVHRLTSVGQGRTSLAQIAIEQCQQHLKTYPGSLTVIGVSPMTKRCAQAFAGQRNIIVVNRSLDKAQALAKEVGGQALSLEEWQKAPPATSALVSATGAANHVVGNKVLERLIDQSPHKPLLVDMAVPPDIDEDAAIDLALKRLDMEHIIAIADGNRENRLAEVADARLLVDKSLEDFRRTICERLMSPLITELRQHSQNSANKSLEKLLRKDLQGLNDGQVEGIRRWSRALVNKLIHLPSAGLRALAFDAGPEAVEAFLSGADRELSELLKNISEQTEELAALQENLH